MPTKRLKRITAFVEPDIYEDFILACKGVSCSQSYAMSQILSEYIKREDVQAEIKEFKQKSMNNSFQRVDIQV